MFKIAIAKLRDVITANHETTISPSHNGISGEPSALGIELDTRGGGNRRFDGTRIDIGRQYHSLRISSAGNATSHQPPPRHPVRLVQRSRDWGGCY